MSNDPLTFRFEDDGETPNNPRLPLVLYRGAVDVKAAADPVAFQFGSAKDRRHKIEQIQAPVNERPDGPYSVANVTVHRTALSCS